MAALWNRAGHYFFPSGFYLSSFYLFFLSSPNLSSRRLDVYHTSTHGVAYSANSECRSQMCCSARGSLEIQDAKKLPSAHYRTTLSGCIFATKACIDNRKKMLNSNISSRCPHNMANFGPLTAEICWQVWGTPANFNGFRVLASLLQRCCSLKANQTLHDVWPSPGLVCYIYIFGALAPDRILPGAKFTLRSSLAFSYIGSVTARHSSSRRQPNFAEWYKEWNYGTFAEGATYMRLGGHHIGHRPTL